MTPLSAFGLFAVSAMMISYAIGVAKPLVHTRFRRVVRSRLNLWFSARRVAVRNRGSHLVADSVASLVEAKTNDQLPITKSYSCFFLISSLTRLISSSLCASNLSRPSFVGW